MNSNLKRRTKAFTHFISKPQNVLNALLFSVPILFVFQWLFALDQLWSAVNLLGFLELPQYLVEGFFNFLRYSLDDFRPTALLVIALMQGSTIAILRSVEHIKKPAYKSLVTALVGSGCAACSGSIIAPLLSGLAAGTASFIAGAASRILLVTALFLGAKSFTQAVDILVYSNKAGQK